MTWQILVAGEATETTGLLGVWFQSRGTVGGATTPQLLLLVYVKGKLCVTKY